MAAKTIKGITIEIDGKTTKLASALKEVETPARSLGTNLKNVNKALKLDPTNTELLSEKQKILASYVDVTREKLEKMESVQDQIRQQYANGDIDQGAYVAFQKELEYTKDKLKSLQQQQKEFGDVTAQVMKEAGSKVSEFGDKISGVGDKISSVGDKISGTGTKLLPVTAAITAAGASAVSAGSDMIESLNKVEVAFGDSADSVKKFSESTLDAYGIAEGTALDMAALFGDMATSMDIPQNSAAQMSEKLVGLAGDLASFKNIELETAQNALKGIFTGETESLKSLGIVMNEDTLLRFAMQQGMINTTKSAQQLAEEELALEKAQVSYNNAVKKYGENSLEAREAALKVSKAEETLNESAKASLDTLSTAEKVQLRYAYVLNATQNAQGDFARTSDGAANSMRIASEAVKELSADFGVLLAPYVAQVAQMISALIKSFIALPEETKKTILVVAALVAGLGPLLIIVGKIISSVGSFITWIGKLVNGVGSIIKAIGKIPSLAATVKAAFATLSGAFTSMISAAGSALSWLGGVLSSALTSVVGAIGSALTWLGSALSSAVTSLLSAIGSAISWLAANPMVLIVAAVVAAIAAIIAAIVWLWNNCDGFREFWINTWEAIKGAFSSFCTWVVEQINNLKTIFAGFGDAIGEIGNSIAEWWNGTIDGVVAYCSELPGKIDAAIQSAISNVTAWGSNLKDQAVSAISSLVSSVYSKASQIPGLINSAIQGALSYVMSWGANLKNAAANAIENVRSSISSGLERVKSLFHFEWSLPHIKLPHFTVSGSFSLNPLQVPSIGVQWYAKGGILNGAQIFGALGNKLLGGGEAGPEAVLPLSGFYSELRSILASFMGSSGESLDLTGLYNRLDGIYERLGRLQVVLDTGTLVGETVDQYDAALAEKQMLAERGV